MRYLINVWLNSLCSRASNIERRLVVQLESSDANQLFFWLSNQCIKVIRWLYNQSQIRIIRFYSNLSPHTHTHLNAIFYALPKQIYLRRHNNEFNCLLGK